MTRSTPTILTRTVRRVLGTQPAAEQDARELELRLAPYAVTETTIRVPHQRGGSPQTF